MADDSIVNDAEMMIDDTFFRVQITHYYNASNEPLYALFDSDYSATLLNEIEVQNSDPIIRIKTSDMNNVTMASRFVIDSTNYYPRRIHPDDHGITMIELTEDQG